MGDISVKYPRLKAGDLQWGDFCLSLQVSDLTSPSQGEQFLSGYVRGEIGTSRCVASLLLYG